MCDILICACKLCNSVIFSHIHFDLCIGENGSFSGLLCVISFLGLSHYASGMWICLFPRQIRRGRSDVNFLPGLKTNQGQAGHIQLTNGTQLCPSAKPRSEVIKALVKRGKDTLPPKCNVNNRPQSSGLLYFKMVKLNQPPFSFFHLVCGELTFIFFFLFHRLV